MDAGWWDRKIHLQWRWTLSYSPAKGDLSPESAGNTITQIHRKMEMHTGEGLQGCYAHIQAQTHTHNRKHVIATKNSRDAGRWLILGGVCEDELKQ